MKKKETWCHNWQHRLNSNCTVVTITMHSVINGQCLQKLTELALPTHLAVIDSTHFNDDPILIVLRYDGTLAALIGQI